MDEYGIDEFKLFEEWLYSKKLNYPKDSDDPSLLLVKVFCLAKDVGISNLQNATLDTIRDLATEQHGSLATPNTVYEQYAKPQSIFGSAPRPVFGLPKYQTTTSPGLEEPVAKYLPPATASAIRYAYQKTSELSPLRRLLTDIFAYDVKPEALYEDFQSLPAEFMADVLLITKKRLPFRLKAEEADFDKNADKYHVHDSSSIPNDRNQRTSEDVEVRGTKSDLDPLDGPAAEVAVPEPELPTDASAVNEDNTWGFGGFGGSAKSLNKKEKKKGKSTIWA